MELYSIGKFLILGPPPFLLNSMLLRITSPTCSIRAKRSLDSNSNLSFPQISTWQRNKGENSLLESVIICCSWIFL